MPPPKKQQSPSPVEYLVVGQQYDAGPGDAEDSDCTTTQRWKLPRAKLTDELPNVLADLGVVDSVDQLPGIAKWADEANVGDMLVLNSDGDFIVVLPGFAKTHRVVTKTKIVTEIVPEERG